MRTWRGLKALTHDAVDFTTELVREGHESSARAVMRVLGAIEPIAETAKDVDQARRVVTDGVLGSIRAVNRAVEGLTDAALDELERHSLTRRTEPNEASPAAALPLRSDAIGSLPWLGDAGLGVLNGAVGGYLHAAESALDLGMKFRVGASYLPTEPAELAQALRGASPRLALFIHGLSATEWSWCLDGATNHGDPSASFGALLERDLGYTPIFLRYNSGRHVSENGCELAAQLERLVDALPAPLEEMILVGHSMGGLVARSACHYASLEGRRWPSRVTHVFSIGTPHRGAPLEKLTAIVTTTLQTIDVPGTLILGRILAGRSAGMKDLRQGALVDEDWLGRDADSFVAPDLSDIPHLPNARYYFISATVTRDPSHPLGRLVGDLLVRVPSASGRHTEEHDFPIEVRTHGGLLHHQLQNHPAVYEQIREACEARTMATTDKVFSGSIPALYESQLVPLIFQPYADDLVRRLRPLSPKHVLELAAGTGVVTRALATAFDETTTIVATDLNQAMLDHARAMGTSRSVEWRQADAMQLPFADAAFDAVVCQFGAMFFPDKARAFAEALRVLRPGGTFAFSVWDSIENNEFADVVTASLEPLFPEDPPRFLARTPHGYHDKQRIARDVAAGGFREAAKIETVALRSRAESASVVAVAYCQGTPLRNEIEARAAERLTEATDVATTALAKRFGTGPVDGKIQAHVVVVRKGL